MSAAFLLYGATLALAWFTAMNLVVGVIAGAIGGRLLKSSEVGSPGRWLALRLAPSVFSLAFVVFVFIPSYFKFEPRSGFEGFDATLSLVALVGAAALVAGVTRGTAAYLRARRRVASWMRSPEPFDSGAGLPAFIVDADAPLVALAGIWRPRLLIARQLVTALSKSELAASVAHELNHHRALDNLKRLAICAAPDVWFPRATLSTRWALAAEYAADRLAADDVDSRCALASALVKVARLTPPTVFEPAAPVSTLIGGGDIANRVTKLLDDRRPTPGSGNATLTFAATMLAIATTVVYSPVLRAVHEITEHLVHSLP